MRQTDRTYLERSIRLAHDGERTFGQLVRLLLAYHRRERRVRDRIWLEQMLQQHCPGMYCAAISGALIERRDVA